MLRKRVITALWGFPLLVAAIWFDQSLPWFTTLAAICGVLAVIEFYRLVTLSRALPLIRFGALWVLLFILSRDSRLLGMIGPYFDLNLMTPLLFTSAVLLPLIWIPLQRQKEKTFAGWAWTVAGILYVGWLVSYLVALRGMDDGRNWVFFAFFTTFASDTMAFFVGRALGKNRLAPSISPNKTREGTIGGILGAAGVSLLFLLPTPLHLNLHWGQALLLGFLVSIFGQCGDLAESLFKRNMRVKDSGNIMPGHGGLLDRLDSILFAGIVVYYYVLWTT
ncbi:MAG: phosphatidate cytidylyltransferase [Dehalococcoidales bacterium]|nr:phosphatidate cytidylyltransferase [Dehalococcoidales bacterium]MDZ4230781.1 phosphatidate cytidylyltransferase [Dehalococcoidales bacterium]